MNDLPLSALVASRLTILPESGSTNAELRSLSEDAQRWPHLSVLLTDNQTAGRGRLDRTWVAPPGASVAISVLLRDLPTSITARGWIPLAAGVAMADAVGAQLPDHRVSVKWPNDVLVNERKICGILAEAAHDSVIVGTGVNTTMTAVQLPVPAATSFSVLGAHADIDQLVADYLRMLSELVTALADAGDAEASGLHAAASARCTTLGRDVRVLLPGDRVLLGTAIALDSDGRLVVAAAGSTHAVSAGDVVHVRPQSG